MKYSPSTRLPMSRPCMSVKATMTVSISPFLTSAASCSLVSIGSLRDLATAASPRDEALEELAGPGQVGGQLFGVALHRNDKAVVGLDAFNGAVVAVGGLLEPVGQLLDSLMVKAVDPDLVLAGRPPQLRRRIHLDRVRQVAAPQRAHLVTLQMLNQRASHGHVDDLLAAADAQHREPTLSRLVEKRQLGLV